MQGLLEPASHVTDRNYALPTMPTSQALLDALLDLSHDLGKHLQLPLALLPKSATAQQLISTVHDCLLRTRRSAHGDVSARALWDAFVSETASPWQQCSEFVALERSVVDALAWEPRLNALVKHDDTTAIRQAIAGDFRRVADCIAAVIAKVQSERQVPR